MSKKKSKTFKNVLIVLGCQPNSDGSPSNYMINRVRKAVQLYKKNKYSKVIFSGGAAGYKVPESEIMRTMAIKYIPHNKILVEKNSKDTIHNAVFVWEMIKDKDPKKITIVTSDWHIPRTKFIFKNAYRHLKTSLIFEPVKDNIDIFERIYKTIKEFFILSYFKIFGIK